MVKKCRDCGKWKSLDEYYKDKKAPGGLRHSCKECISIKGKRYREQNHEAVLERKRHYRERNRDYINAYQRQYQEENSQSYREYQRLYYRRHSGERIDYVREWRRANTDKVFLYKARRRGRKRNDYTTIEHIVARWEFYGSCCYLCGAPAEATDHVIPLARGGSHWPANLRPICNKCNSSKGSSSLYDLTIRGSRGDELPGELGRGKFHEEPGRALHVNA